MTFEYTPAPFERTVSWLAPQGSPSLSNQKPSHAMTSERYYRLRLPQSPSRVAAALLATIALAGCGTTRMTDTVRTGTEQLLLSAAVDRAINDINFQPLAGKEVYFDAQYLRGIVDEGYVVSSLRQHLLANGCILKRDREEAMYVVEARAGAVGTNRQDVLLGIPSVSLPNVTGMPGVPSAIPEIPFAKSTQQKGVAKLAMFCYNQRSGQPVWQSGAFPVMATSRDTWVLGTGPFQRGTIYEGTRFAGSRIMLPFGREKAQPLALNPSIPVNTEAVFTERPMLAQNMPYGRPPTGGYPPAGAPPGPWPPPGQEQRPPATREPEFTPKVPPNPAGPPVPPATPPTLQGPVSGGNSAAGILFLGQTPWMYEQSQKK